MSSSSSLSYACPPWPLAMCMRLLSSCSMSSTVVMRCTSSWSSVSMAYPFSCASDCAGSARCSAGTIPGSMVSGNTTTKCTYMLPFWKGRPSMGIPSSAMHLKVSGLMTSPGGVVSLRMRPSRCLMCTVAPHSASVNVIFFSMIRSMLTRLNVSCSFCWMTSTTSPGRSPGSLHPASPRSTILEPCFMPAAMCTSLVFFSLTRHLPLQLPHWSLAGVE
mmetsp:Transcript_31222/g.79606  ORF Transcript_31222/g.79606 Transcript_31222/m.79606 type:complete len:218 (+) Transcript_31222:633-1286(+)